MNAFHTKKLCNKCRKTFNLGNYDRHICVNDDDCKKILELYNNGLALQDLCAKGYSKGVINIVLTGHRRSRSEAVTNWYKLHSVKLSEETKKLISIARKKYLQEHPDEVPYLKNHSSRDSWPEKMFKKALDDNNITGYIQYYRNSLYEYDFAFPLLKIDVEIDGDTHKLEKTIEIDNKRDKFAKQQGWTVVRFKAKHVLRNVDDCIRLLKIHLENTSININEEIDKSFLMLRTTKERHKAERQTKKQERTNKNDQLSRQKINDRIALIKDIDLTKFGSITQISKLWHVSHTQVRRLLKLYELKN